MNNVIQPVNVRETRLLHVTMRHTVRQHHSPWSVPALRSPYMQSMGVHYGYKMREMRKNVLIVTSEILTEVKILCVSQP
jgi:hypothetical protein